MNKSTADDDQAVGGAEALRRTLEEMRQALWEGEERFRVALQSVPITVATMDSALRYLWVYNLHLASDPQDALGKRDDELLPPEDVAELVQFKQRVLDTGVGACREVSVRLPDGVRYYDVTADLLRNELGEVVGLITAALDITEQKKLQEALRESQARLVALETAVEQRVAERTAQWQELVAELDRSREQEQRRLAHVLHNDLQQLLVAARLHINTMRHRLMDQALLRAIQRVDEVLEEAIGTLRFLTAEFCPPMLYDEGLAPALRWLARWLEERYHLAVAVEAGELYGQCSPSARAMLFQAARELLLNVVKQADAQQVTLRLQQVEEQIELAISVEDAAAATIVADGGGMSLPDGGGAVPLAGPGELADIRRRLALFNGWLAVESQPGVGPLVTLRVPLSRGAEGTTATEAARGAVREVARGAAYEVAREKGAAPIRVVLADDHAIVREGLARLLEEAPGIELVGEAGDGREAVELARKLRPDVVLMDVSMPGMDGVEATQLILAEQPQIKIIGLSMYEEDQAGAQMRQVGAVDYVLKEGDQTALVRAVRHWGRRQALA